MSADSAAFTLMQFVEYDRQNPAAQPTERLTGTIRLPLPTAVPDTSAMSIDASDLGLWGTSLEQVNRFAASAGAAWSAAGGKIDTFLSQNGGDIVKSLVLYAPGLSDSALGQNINRYFGQVKNPHTTAIFSGVNLRRHSLTWRFAPRSQADAEALEAIYREFKIRSHPKLDFNGFALNYPEQVYITFPNTKLTPVRKSFITTVNITSGSGDQIPLFADGTPVERTLMLETIEVDIITRDELEGTVASADDPETVVNGAADDSPRPPRMNRGML